MHWVLDVLNCILYLTLYWKDVFLVSSCVKKNMFLNFCVHVNIAHVAYYNPCSAVGSLRFPVYSASSVLLTSNRKLCQLVLEFHLIPQQSGAGGTRSNCSQLFWKTSEEDQKEEKLLWVVVAAKEISMAAAIAAVLSKLGAILTIEALKAFFPSTFPFSPDWLVYQPRKPWADKLVWVVPFPGSASLLQTPSKGLLPDRYGR